MTVIDSNYTPPGWKMFFPNISPSAVCTVEGQGGSAAQRWCVIWSHVRTTSGLTEQEADEADLNNYLQVPEYAKFTDYSSIIILNI